MNVPMTRAQAAQLLALAASYDQRTVGEADVTAWLAALHGTDYAACEAAILAHAKNSRERITPADILAIIREARRQRAQRVNARPTGLTDRHAAQRAARHGMTEIYRRMGWRRETSQAAALAVPCPACRAEQGVPCRRVGRARSGRRETRDLVARVHPSRLAAAVDQGYGDRDGGKA